MLFSEGIFILVQSSLEYEDRIHMIQHRLEQTK